MTLLATLLSPLLASDFVTNVKTAAKAIGLLPDSWVALDPEDAIVNSVGQTAATQWNTYATVAIQGGFLDTAALIGNPTGLTTIPANAWIKLLASSVFNVTAIPAAFGSGTWNGTNSTTNPIGPYAPGQLKFYNLDNNGLTYSNTTTVTFAPSATTGITISADTIGTAGSANPNRVALLTTILGLSGVNPQAINGIDAESGPALASRCRLKYASLSPNGPSQAYAYIALTPSLNGGINVNRVSISPSSTNGTVSMIIASPNGAPNVGDPAALQAILYTLAVPDTVKLTVTGAVAHTINITWVAYYHSSAGINAATEMANGNTALSAYFASQACPIGGDVNGPSVGGFIYQDKLLGILGGALPKAFDITMSIPGGDTAILSTEVPTLGTIPTNPAVAIQVVQ